MISAFQRKHALNTKQLQFLAEDQDLDPKNKKCGLDVENKRDEYDAVSYPLLLRRVLSFRQLLSSALLRVKGRVQFVLGKAKRLCESGGDGRSASQDWL